MKNAVKLAVVALALTGGSFAAALPARADGVSVGINLPGIAFGYSDGYWDRDHHWHAWKNREEAARFREENRDHYYEQRHDHDHGDGWRDERYWDHH